MCGRFVQVWDKTLQRHVRVFMPYGEDAVEEVSKDQDEERAYNIAPSRTVAALAADDDIALIQPRWGFPIKNKDVSNTRIERAYESPMWRGVIEKHHAVVPMQGFYEWKRMDGEKQPYFIHRADGDPMNAAAVVGTRKVHDEQRTVLSIVTTHANDWMQTLHDRMPVVLENEDVTRWLHPAKTGHDAILDLAEPTHAELEAYPVSTEVNNSRNHGKHLLEPVTLPDQDSKQATLF